MPRPLITSVRVEKAYGHDRVRVWNRGGHAGELTVTNGDGAAVADRLLGGGLNWEQRETSTVVSRVLEDGSVEYVVE